MRLAASSRGIRPIVRDQLKLHSESISKEEKQEKKVEERMRGVTEKEREEAGKRGGGEEKRLIILKMFKLSMLCVLHVGSLH